MDERGRGGYHRQLDPTEGEISVYHISLPAVPADALTDPFASCLPDCYWFKLVRIFDKQPNSQTGQDGGNALHSCNTPPSKIKR